MKKIMLFVAIVSMAIMVSSCQNESSLKKYCGKEILSKEVSLNHAGGHDRFFLCFKKDDGPNFDYASVTKAEYEYYQPGKIIDCEVKVVTGLPPGKID